MSETEDIELRWLPSETPLPAFADEKNKAVQREIEEIADKIRRRTADVRDIEDRSKTMENHMKNVELEISHAQLLLEARKKEAESEEHIRQLIFRDGERLKAQIARIKKETEQQSEYHNSLQNDLFNVQTKLRNYESEAQWNRNEFAKWRLAQQQKAEDSFALKKYSKIDSEQTKRLDLQISEYRKQIISLNEKLNKEVLDTRTAQLALDKAAVDFEEMQQQRQTLLSRFRESIESMEQRDKQISDVSAGVQKARSELARLKDELTLKHRSEQNARRLTEKMMKEAHLAEANKAEVFYKMTQIRQRRVEMEDAVNLNRNILNKLNSTNTMLRERQNDALANKRQREEKQISLKKSIEELTGEKLLIMSRNLSEAERLEAINKMLLSVEQELAREDQHLRKSKEQLIQTTTHLHDLKREETVVQSEIEGSKTLIRNLKSRILRLDEEAELQRNHLYSIEFNIQMLERQISRVSGERSEEELIELRKTISSLEENLGQEQTTQKLLRQQMKQSSKNNKKIEQKLEDLKEIHGKLDGEIQELVLILENSKKETTKLERERDNKRLDFDLLNIKLKGVKEKLQMEEDNESLLKNRNSQLDTTIAEKKVEINTTIQMLKNELNLVTKEKVQDAKSLKEQQIMLEKLHAKFLVICARMKTDDPGDIEIKSDVRNDEYFSKTESEEMEHITKTRAALVLRAARERSELKDEGDRLNAKILEMERDIRLLGRTYDALVRTNDANRRQGRAEQTGEEAAILQRQIQDANGKLAFLQQEIREIDEESRFARETLTRLQDECDGLAEQVQAKTYEQEFA